MKNVALAAFIEQFDIELLHSLVVDIGAAEGCYTSVSYPLLVDYDWRGILIEPQEEQLAKAKQYHVDRLDRVEFLNCAICDYDGEVDLYLHPNDGNGNTTCNHGSSLLPIPGSHHRVRVPAMSYATLVEKIDFEQVGILGIDAEGYDLNILQGIFSCTSARPQVIITEADYFLCPSVREHRKVYLDDIYECVFDHEDQVFVQKVLL